MDAQAEDHEKLKVRSDTRVQYDARDVGIVSAFTCVLAYNPHVHNIKSAGHILMQADQIHSRAAI